jgi:hypothetical protein
VSIYDVFHRLGAQGIQGSSDFIFGYCDAAVYHEFTLGATQHRDVTTGTLQFGDAFS